MPFFRSCWLPAALLLGAATGALAARCQHSPHQPTGRPAAAKAAEAAPVPSRADPALDSLLACYEQLFAAHKTLRRQLATPPVPAYVQRRRTALAAEQAHLCDLPAPPTLAAARVESQRDADLKRRDQALGQLGKAALDSVRQQAPQQLATAEAALTAAAQAAGQRLRARRGGFVFQLHGTTYQAYVADLATEAVRVHLDQDSARGSKFTTLEQLRRYYVAHDHQPAMLTNGGMFHADQQPVGLLVEHGRTRRPLNTQRPGTDENFYMQPNGVFFVDAQRVAHVDSTGGYQRVAGRYRVLEATQSGPLLVAGGRLNPHFQELSANAKVRSGVGVLNDQGSDGSRVVFLATEGGNTFYDFATAFRDLFGCANALFLDGAISKMYLADAATPYEGGFFGPLLAVSSPEPLVAQPPKGRAPRRRLPLQPVGPAPVRSASSVTPLPQP